jgi:undecaprenyl-diphosphatase
MDSILEEIDHKIVLAINGFHNPMLDQIMWVISSKAIWIPFYILMIYLASIKLINFKRVFLFIIIAILSVIVSDLISTYCFKEVFQRFRPSHNLLLFEKLHFYQNKPGEFYRGGLYGFISSHAANFFAIAFFVGLALKEFYPKLIYILLLIASIVSLSRIYLGVHYFSDIFVGGIVGSLISLLFYKYVYLTLFEKIK